jgi:CheY-like chemotaxis protein
MPNDIGHGSKTIPLAKSLYRATIYGWTGTPAYIFVAIAVTAYAREEDRRAAFATGFQDHLAKPIDPTQLIGLVANLMNQAKRSATIL